ncbi:MAG: AI-2E family transporter [Actinomycetota bacterium]|nr:AI-2E family transporter [Actinomycetota bacterium]
MPPPYAPRTVTVFRIVFSVVAALVLVYAAYLVRSTLVLVVVAAFLAVGLDPAVRGLERLGLKRGQAIAALFVGIVLVVGGFLFAVIPPLVGQVTSFATNLPGYIQDVAHSNPRVERFVIENDIPNKLRAATKSAPTLIGGSLGALLGVAGSVIGTIFKMLTVLVLTIYFMLSLARIRTGTLRLIPKSNRGRATELLDPILEKIGGYVAGNIAISIIAGVLAFVFLSLAHVPFPVALALWVAIADLIPLVGATLGAVPAVIVAFVGSIPLGIATVIYFIVYQQAENYLIAPRVMTKAVDLSPAAVLLAALIGASLLGFVGALMAIPAAASLKLVMQEIVLPSVEER